MDNLRLKVSKCRTYAKIPTRGTSKSDGLDLYVPDIDLEGDEQDYHSFIRDFQYHNGMNHNVLTRLIPEYKCIIIAPHERVFIPLGIRIKVPVGSALLVLNKSGVSYKQCMARLSCLIDEDYQGEIISTLFNYSNNIIKVQLGQKIAQIIRIPAYYDGIEEVPNNELFLEESERNSGKMGSTGLN
jgi:dUTP pyrophosphatase